MGVHGLSSYLQEHRRMLSRTLEAPSSAVSGCPHLVVDGWSFIYAIQYHPDLDWVYGGEYERLCQVIKSVVEAWLAVGFSVHFVFDGPYPPLKFATAISRLEQTNIQHGLLFFRTSAASRNTPRFLHESRIIPPLSYSACIHTLKRFPDLDAGRDFSNGPQGRRLTLHFADEEGDPYAVELAARLGGYVCGYDSDFVILNGDGYAGYVPMNEMVWTAAATEPGHAEANHDDDTFQPVASRKTKKVAKQTQAGIAGRGIIPPEHASDITLTFAVYTPALLASHLQIPPSMLPLLAALVGNDFTRQYRSSPLDAHPFFERSLPLSHRIERVATALRGVVSGSASPSKWRTRPPPDAMEIIERAVGALLLRPAITSSNEKDALVERVIAATLQYALPKADPNTPLWPTHVCALHDPSICPLVATLTQACDVAAGSRLNSGDGQIYQRYITAYRDGDLAPPLLDAIHSASFWPKLFLESPDLESVSRSLGREIRLWIYAILHDSIGIPSTSEDARSGIPSEEDEDELIDVVEDATNSSDEDGVIAHRMTDGAAELHEKLQQAHMDDKLPESGRLSETPSRTPLSQPFSPSTSHPQTAKPPVITEYVRRGSKISNESVECPTVDALLASNDVDGDGHKTWPDGPILIWDADARFNVLLHAMHSCAEAVRSVPPFQLAVVLALRSVLRQLHARAEASGSVERQRERWTRREARAFLRAIFLPDALLNDAIVAPTSPDTPAALGPGRPDILDRHVQLMAQFLMALGSVELLVQTLLLSDRVPSAAHLLSGRRVHSALLRKAEEDGAVRSELENVWKACIEGLDDAFAPEVSRQRDKGRAKIGRVPAPPSRGHTSGRGMFSVLAEAS
ncbi:hypothetical protein PUNSTDRAFT_121825 [Punctularia strigosozonata HHB-11173 SS5]|uniref:uncharacterized protein n=1 Tax=Punctularia strigosozonata (strain HHB-11173) TaxID=741275 RepID=UPI000441656D|nr:uncharacterized protein PUNSTDRAFT_121825 [Punctularia strigosozonata HHB-11173 SS5]EIN06712.1 hypothetical protein PUNSTDRAFT_121825 [Punctularia strigosozonata HHB-11173 SS5]